MTLRKIRDVAQAAWSDISHRRLKATFAKKRLCAKYGNVPVPLSAVVFLRQRMNAQNSLLPMGWTVKTPGRTLKNPFLAEHLASVDLGVWSLSAWALHFLASEIQHIKPVCVLEFGCGLSTISLARYMQELYGAGQDVCLYSIEQEASFIETTRKRLSALGLASHVRFLHAPLGYQNIEGVETICYNLTPESLKEFLGNSHPDFILIDGPEDDSPNVRFGTLPLVRAFLAPSARFFLDDALRDDELCVAQRWEQLPYITLQGIYLYAKGALIGTIGRNDFN